MLFTIEEADKRELLVEKPVKTGKDPGGRRGPVQTGLTRKQYTFGNTSVEKLAESLETMMKRDRLPLLEEITLRTSGHLLNILQIKNLMTRLSPDKAVTMNLEVTLRRTSEPRYTLQFTVDKKDASSDEGKNLLDIAWKMKGCESSDIRLLIKWTTGTTGEEASKLLRTLSGGDEAFIASLEAKVSRRPT